MFENEETAKCILLSGRSIMVKRRGVQHTMKVDVMELTTSRALVFAQRDNTAICTNCSRRPINLNVRTKQHRSGTLRDVQSPERCTQTTSQRARATTRGRIVNLIPKRPAWTNVRVWWSEPACGTGGATVVTKKQILMATSVWQHT